MPVPCAAPKMPSSTSCPTFHLLKNPSSLPAIPVKPYLPHCDHSQPFFHPNFTSAKTETTFRHLIFHICYRLRLYHQYRTTFFFVNCNWHRHTAQIIEGVSFKWRSYPISSHRLLLTSCILSWETCSSCVDEAINPRLSPTIICRSRTVLNSTISTASLKIEDSVLLSAAAIESCEMRQVKRVIAWINSPVYNEFSCLKSEWVMCPPHTCEDVWKRRRVLDNIALLQHPTPWVGFCVPIRPLGAGQYSALSSSCAPLPHNCTGGTSESKHWAKSPWIFLHDHVEYSALRGDTRQMWQRERAVTRTHAPGQVAQRPTPLFSRTRAIRICSCIAFIRGLNISPSTPCSLLPSILSMVRRLHSHACYSIALAIQESELLHPSQTNMRAALP